MKDASSADPDMLLAYLNGELVGPDLESFEKRLLEEEALRKALIELSIEEVTLADWARTQELTAELDDQTFSTLDAPRDGGSEAIPTANSYGRWLATAVALMVCVCGFLWILERRGSSASKRSTAPSVAHLIASVDANWVSTAPHSRSQMPIGQYELSSGSIDLGFTCGAKVSISGPAKFELVNARRLHLESGNLIARIPDEALGFIVTSPQSEVVDLGTEFGLAVSGEGQTDVHVLDGLVEVLPRDRERFDPGLMIAEGSARRFENSSGTQSNEIPVRSRESLLGSQQFKDLGVQMLGGSIRINDQLGADSYGVSSSGQNWIDLVSEKRNVKLVEPLVVTLNASGSYRRFGLNTQTVAAGTSVNSYLLHFRPSTWNHVRGVIRFDTPIVGVLCTPKELGDSDAIFGVPNIDYPTDDVPRGLEPGRYFEHYVATAGKPVNFQPDEVILSQDRRSLSINASADPESGYYDQVRILTLVDP